MIDDNVYLPYFPGLRDSSDPPNNQTYFLNKGATGPGVSINTQAKAAPPTHKTSRERALFIMLCCITFTFFICHLPRYVYLLNWNASKGNQAPIQKFERPNQKIPESKNFLTSVKNWCPQLT